MLSRALLVAAIAGALLLVTVGVDLAFNSTVELGVAGPGEDVTLVASGPLDGSRMTHVPKSHTLNVNATDDVTFTLTLENAMPWSVARDLTLSIDGCYEGARQLATFRLRAEGQGMASDSVTLKAADLAYGNTIPKRDDEGVPPSAFVNVCRGERYIAAAQLTLEEVPR